MDDQKQSELSLRLSLPLQVDTLIPTRDTVVEVFPTVPPGLEEETAAFLEQERVWLR